MFILALILCVLVSVIGIRFLKRFGVIELGFMLRGTITHPAKFDLFQVNISYIYHFVFYFYISISVRFQGLWKWKIDPERVNPIVLNASFLYPLETPEN